MQSSSLHAVSAYRPRVLMDHCIKMTGKIAVLVFLLMVCYTFSCYRQMPEAQPRMKDTATIPQARHPYRLPRDFTPLLQSSVNSVEKFVVFIGWPRSGHSIIGRMLDAHPNVIVGGMSALNDSINKTAIFNWIYEDSYNKAKWPYHTRANIRAGGLWQGRFEELKVIGDLKHPTGLYLKVSSSEFQGFCKRLASVMIVPIYAILVVRNPYDMIASATLYEAEYRDSGRRGVKVETLPGSKYRDVALLKQMAKESIDQTEAVADMITLCDLTVLEIHHADHIRDPVTVMQNICHFLDLECFPYYLEKCSSETHKYLPRARDSVVWTPEIIDMVEEEIQTFPFFQRYTFDMDYL